MTSINPFNANSQNNFNVSGEIGTGYYMPSYNWELPAYKDLTGFSNTIFDNCFSLPEMNFDTFNFTSGFAAPALNFQPKFELTQFFNFGFNPLFAPISSTSTASNEPTSKKKSVPKTLDEYRERYGMKEKTLPNGLKANACGWSRFSKCQPEWLGLQKYMLQAAEELGLTLVYSDVERTVAESDAGRAKKGDIVCKGGDSPHNYGVAADIVLFKDGKAVSSASSLQEQFANEVRRLSGNRIEWGGEWTKKGERHHFELRDWESKYKSQQYLVG